MHAKAEDQGLYTLKQHMNELQTLRELAKSNGQISAAVAAEVKRGELMGYYVQHRENTNSNVVYTISDTSLSAEEWKTKSTASARSRSTNANQSMGCGSCRKAQQPDPR